MSTETSNQTVTSKVKRLVDVDVTADVEGLLGRHYYQTNIERRAKDLESAVEEFNSFIRDHRSMDRVSLSVNRTVRDVCAVCGDEWEADTNEDGVVSCASCGRTEVK